MTQMFLKSKQNNISSPSKPQLAPLLKSIDIFDSEGLYLNNIRLFYAYFGKAPSLKNIPNVDCSRIRKWIETTMPGKIINTHSYEKHYKDQSKITCQYIFYVMNNELLLSLSPERNCAEVVYGSGNEYLAQELFDKLKRFKKKDKRTTDINIIISGRSIDLFPIKVKKPTLNISTHYNDDLEPLNNIILKNLNKLFAHLQNIGALHFPKQLS